MKWPPTSLLDYIQSPGFHETIVRIKVLLIQSQPQTDASIIVHIMMHVLGDIVSWGIAHSQEDFLRMYPTEDDLFDAIYVRTLNFAIEA